MSGRSTSSLRNLRPEIELSIHEHPAVELESTENRVVNEQEEVQEQGEAPRVIEPQNLEQVWLPINPTPELADLKPKSQAVTDIQAIEFENIDQFRVLMAGIQPLCRCQMERVFEF